MTLQQCRYLTEISKHRSISKAAEALYVTQPTISKAILELEAELGIRILERTNKGVSFTQQGKEALFYARMLLEQADAAVSHFRTNGSEGRERLSISSQHYGFVVEAMSQWMTTFLGQPYEIILREGKTTNVIDEVASGRSALGILTISPLNRSLFERAFLSKSLVFTPLCRLNESVFLRKSHPLANHSSITPEQLRPYPCLTYHRDDIPLYYAENFLELHTLSQIVYLRDRGAMNDLLSHTNGYNLGTGCLVSGYMPSNILSIPLAEPLEIQLGYLQKYGQPLSNAASHYLHLLRESLERALLS